MKTYRFKIIIKDPYTGKEEVLFDCNESLIEFIDINELFNNVKRKHYYDTELEFKIIKYVK